MSPILRYCDATVDLELSHHVRFRIYILSISDWNYLFGILFTWSKAGTRRSTSSVLRVGIADRYSKISSGPSITRCMSPVCFVNEDYVRSGVSLSDFLEARPSGLTENEAWAILCQAVQSLQDLFLSDSAQSEFCIPLVTPTTVLLSSRGRIKFYQNLVFLRCGPPTHLMGYLAPEYRSYKQCSDAANEKMWIYGLGQTLKTVTLTSQSATSKLSDKLYQVFTDMTKPQPSVRASLMYLLDIISDYCRKRAQSKPFSHIVMDLHQEAAAHLETTYVNLWTRNTLANTTQTQRNRATRRYWMGAHKTKPRTREASTSMEDLSSDYSMLFTPGSVIRPKSMCLPFEIDSFKVNNDIFIKSENVVDQYENIPTTNANSKTKYCDGFKELKRPVSIRNNFKIQKCKMRKNPINRSASRLYRSSDVPLSNDGNCVGPEFVIRASLPSQDIVLPDCKGSLRKNVLVIMLNGQKIDVTCNPNTTTAGEIFELIMQQQQIEENFMLGLSALISGDFVFLPSDARICKAINQESTQGLFVLTLFVRVRFFHPNLKSVAGFRAHHLIYLQTRRSILEYQLPCNYNQIIEFGGLALQAEFGDFVEKQHGARDYFLLEHYVPETIICNLEENKGLRQDLTKAHMKLRGLTVAKAEQNFIASAQRLPYYGGHFYAAVWALKSGDRKNVWLHVSSQGINLYERNVTNDHWTPTILEKFEWRTIQTLCYSKQYLCILPHSSKGHILKFKKYKLKMDHKKSYFTFRLASLHHQFFLRIRTQHESVNSLSEQFGIQLKNKTNSLNNLESLTNFRRKDSNYGTVNAATEFEIEMRASPKSIRKLSFDDKGKRSKSIGDFNALNNCYMMEEYQNKENETPRFTTNNSKCYDSLILDTNSLPHLPNNNSNIWDKRKGVKMGVRAFSNNLKRVSRSMEAVNEYINDNLEQASLQSTSLHCSSTSLSKSSMPEYREPQDAYIIDSSIKSCGNQFLPDFQETLSDTLLEKLNKFSFTEERILQTIRIERNVNGSLGLQIMEGIDGKVYVQSVIEDGPANIQGNIEVGDQIVGVNGRNLLSMKYEDALEVLKCSGQKVELVISHVTSNNNKSRANDKMSITKRINDTYSKSAIDATMNNLKCISYQQANLNYWNSSQTVQKLLSETYNNASRLNASDVPYHKHIRYGLDSDFNTNNNDDISYNKCTSKSCTQSNLCNSTDKHDKAVIVDMIPKMNTNYYQSNFLSTNCRSNSETDFSDKYNTGNQYHVPHVPLPRCLGLSRKWRGPVKYPVTPIKNNLGSADDSSTYITTSDEEQVFI